MRAIRRSGRSPARPTLAHAMMILAGLLTFVLVASLLRDRDKTVEVWVAAESIESGTLIDTSQLAVVEVSANDPLLSSLLVAGEVVLTGRVGASLEKGEPLLRTDLVADGLVAAGRSFTIPVDSLVLDGLGLRVGDRLDVIGLAADDSVHYTIVDVAVTRLPGVGQTSAFSSASSRAAWVTVEVDEEQALALSQAILRGDLELVRSTGAEPIELTVSSHAASVEVVRP